MISEDNSSQKNSYTVTTLSIKDSAIWFQQQNKNEADKHNVGDSKDYINTKRELLSSLILSFVFLIPPILVFYYTIIYNNGTEGGNNFIIYILLAAFGVNFASRFVEFIVRLRAPIPDTVPGLFVDKYYESRKRNNRHYSEYYAILNVGNKNVTAIITRKCYHSLDSSAILWMYESNNKIYAVMPHYNYRRYEIEQIMNRYEDTIIQTKDIATSVIEGERLNVHQSLDLIKSSYSNSYLSRKVESSDKYRNILSHQEDLLNKMFIIFFALTIFPNIGIIISLVVFKFTIIPIIFSFVINGISVFLLYSKLRIKKSKVNIVLEGDVLYKKDRVLRNVNTELSNNQNTLLIKCDNKILEVYVDNIEYSDVEVNDKVFIYNYVENKDTIRVIKQT